MRNIIDWLKERFRSVDPATQAAADKAAIRTIAQTARGAGASIVLAVGSTLIGVDWIAVGAIAGASIISTLWAGADAYLDVIGNGVPKEYQAASDAVA